MVDEVAWGVGWGADSSIELQDDDDDDEQTSSKKGNQFMTSRGSSSSSSRSHPRTVPNRHCSPSRTKPLQIPNSRSPSSSRPTAINLFHHRRSTSRRSRSESPFTTTTLASSPVFPISPTDEDGEDWDQVMGIQPWLDMRVDVDDDDDDFEMGGRGRARMRLVDVDDEHLWATSNNSILDPKQ